MKLILHIGMPKAGSSALQRTLARNGKRLEKAGLLYPAGGELPFNHNLLVCGILKGRELPRLLRQQYDGDTERLDAAYEDFLATLRRRMDRSRAGTVLLSGEMLFRPLSGPPEPRLAALLDAASEVELLVYARAPADYYLSLQQQKLKASSIIGPPKDVRYRKVIESWGAIAHSTKVIAYDRRALRDGDIVGDFLHRYAPGAAETVKAAAAPTNASLSAEAMDILHHYRLLQHGEEDGRFTRDTQALVAQLNAADAELPGARPALHAPIREAIERASTDLIWLRDSHQVTFPGIDYDTVGQPAAPVDPPRRVGDICALDGDRREALVLSVIGGLARQTAKTDAPRFATAMPREKGRKKRQAEAGGGGR